MPMLINILDVCTEPEILKVILYIQIILKYVFFIVPIGLMLMMGFDFFKNVTAGREDDMKKNLNLAIKRLIFCVCMFFVPTIVSLVVDIVNDSIEDINIDYQSCLDNTKNIAYYEKIADEEKAKEEEDLNKKIEEQKKLQTEEDEIIRVSVITSTDISSGSSGSTTGTIGGTGSYIGHKYRLSDEQLRGLAMICQNEQGSVLGAKAEASLIANRFELYGSKYGTEGTGLYNYVGNSGWWGSDASYYLKNTSGLRSDIWAAVKEVLVLGSRTLDPYVDEHDCIDCGSYGFDIIKIVTDGTTITDRSGLLNHENYTEYVTKIYNKYGAIYTFTTFPTNSSDPFGYTDLAKSKYDSLNNN